MSIIFAYLPWIMEIQYNHQFFYLIHLSGLSVLIFTSHAIFNPCAYVKWVDHINFCKYSSFSISDATFQGMLSMPHAFKPNTFNSCYEVYLTKVGFSNGGHHCPTITNSSHSYWALAWTRLTTFWSFRLCTTMAFLKMRTFILAWCWCQGFRWEVEGLLCSTFFTIKPCTSFKCLINKHLA